MKLWFTTTARLKHDYASLLPRHILAVDPTVHLSKKPTEEHQARPVVLPTLPSGEGECRHQLLKVKLEASSSYSISPPFDNNSSPTKSATPPLRVDPAIDTLAAQISGTKSPRI